MAMVMVMGSIGLSIGGDQHCERLYFCERESDDRIERLSTPFSHFSCTLLSPLLTFLLFRLRVEHYIKALTSKTKPKKVLVCMIYYPDENAVPSWAGAALGALGYNRDPDHLQTFIRKTFELATSRIRIPGTEVVPVPLFNVLDGKRSEQYVARVEPSAVGGRIMAEYILDLIDKGNGRAGSAAVGV